MYVNKSIFVGVFKNVVKYDAYIDLKTISELYTTEVINICDVFRLI